MIDSSYGAAQPFHPQTLIPRRGQFILQEANFESNQRN
ncbi:hypothetical protein KC19_VG039700 [Ceratodon purpureus]|uniref:Uncharacterized protein n=1 Tax=Ceratodon purpureus TaxID=3225 RepID=A0A8T0HLS0_CERPU|nr:hypothetical protein KC19_VG039700 [Ceratodon purpureus]